MDSSALFAFYVAGSTLAIWLTCHLFIFWFGLTTCWVEDKQQREGQRDFLMFLSFIVTIGCGVVIACNGFPILEYFSK